MDDKPCGMFAWVLLGWLIAVGGILAAWWFLATHLDTI